MTITYYSHLLLQSGQHLYDDIEKNAHIKVFGGRGTWNPEWKFNFLISTICNKSVFMLLNDCKFHKFYINMKMSSLSWPVVF